MRTHVGARCFICSPMPLSPAASGHYPSPKRNASAPSAPASYRGVQGTPNEVDRHQPIAAVHRPDTDCMLAKVDYVARGQKRGLHGRQSERIPAGAEGRGASVPEIERHPSVCRRVCRRDGQRPHAHRSPRRRPRDAAAAALMHRHEWAELPFSGHPTSGPLDDGAGRTAAVLTGDGRRCRLHRGRGCVRSVSPSAGLREAAALPRI